MVEASPACLLGFVVNRKPARLTLSALFSPDYYSLSLISPEFTCHVIHPFKCRNPFRWVLVYRTAAVHSAQD